MDTLKKNPNLMTITERVKAPTPKFFKTLQRVGISVAAVGGAILASPVAIPAALISLAGYLTIAGTVMVAVSQAAVDDEAKKDKDDELEGDNN